ncbi:hypothetical protein Gpo141_00009405 [Globisporangium polare]
MWMTTYSADEFSRRSSKAEKELTAVTHAAVDLRALVEDQVGEKEKWQRYCWELEERLHEAMHTSKAKERDLWKTRDAKKEEARKNMLLYMDAHRGKRHYGDQVSDEISSSMAQSDSQSQSVIPLNAEALETRQVSSADPVR